MGLFDLFGGMLGSGPFGNIGDPRAMTLEEQAALLHKQYRLMQQNPFDAQRQQAEAFARRHEQRSRRYDDAIDAEFTILDEPKALIEHDET